MKRVQVASSSPGRRQARTISETSDQTPGQIRIAFTDVDAQVDKDVDGYAYQPPNGGGAGNPWSGDIWMDYRLNGGQFYEQGGGLLMLHELGHALGLKHPFENGATLPAEFDNLRYTVMSYTDHADSHLHEVEVTGGVAQALVATAIGLVIALVSLFAFNYFSRRIDRLVDELEATASAWLSDLRLEKELEAQTS